MFEYLSKICRETEASLKPDNNNGYFTWVPMYIFGHISLSSSWNEKCSRQNFRENQNTYYMFNNVFDFEIRAVYGKMWKNIVEQGRPQMTIWRTRMACWIPKATNTQTECVILSAFPLQQWLHERASVLRYTYFACVVVNAGVPMN